MAKKQKITETDKEMKQEAKQSEEAEEKKEAMQAEPEMADKKEDAMDPEDHEDVDQDIELIKKLLDEYIGQEADMEKGEAETLKKLAKEAYEAYKEMGYSEEEAKGHAGHALKLAKHMSQKQVAQETEGDEEGGEQGADEQSEAKQSDKSEAERCGAKEAEETTIESEDETESETKESAKVKELETKLLEAQAELAALKLDRAVDEVEKYVEAKLAESKIPRSATKDFRKAAGKIKSKQDFDSKWAIFSEGMKRKQVELDFTSALVEKGAATDNGQKKAKTLDFSNCAE